MKKKLAIMFLGIISIGVTLASTASATILNFENFYDGHADYGNIPPGYEGFNWGTNTAAGWYTKNIGDIMTLTGSSFASGVIGDVAMYTNFARPISMSRLDNAKFDFNSVYITSAWNSVSKVAISGWDGAEEKYHSNLEVLNGSPTLFSFDWAGITGLTLTPVYGYSQQIIFDNLSINEPIGSSEPVPEPATMLLMGTGIAGLAASQRKRLPKK